MNVNVNVNVNVTVNLNVQCNLFAHGAQGEFIRTRSEMSVHSRIELAFGNVGF